MDRYKNLRNVPYPIPPVFDIAENSLRRHAEIEAMIDRGEKPEWMIVESTPHGPRLSMDLSYCKFMQLYNECLANGQQMLTVIHRRK